MSNNKQDNFNINYCEVIKELRKPVSCTKINLIRENNKKKQYINLMPVIDEYSKSTINQLEIIKGKESSNKVVDWLSNCRHPPLSMLNSNEQSLNFKGKKSVKTFQNEKFVPHKSQLHSSIGTFEPNMNSTPLSEHNAKTVKSDDNNVDYCSKEYRKTVNLVFGRCLNKIQSEDYSNLEFVKQNSKFSPGIHNNALGATPNEIFDTTARLFSSFKNNPNAASVLTDNRCPESLNINLDKNFILNTDTTLFKKPDNFSNCSILDFENFLKPVKPRKNNSSRSLFHDTFEQEFNDNVSLDIFSDELQPFNGQEMSMTSTFNGLYRLAKNPEDLLITPNNSSNIVDDVNPLFESSHLLNLLSKDVNSSNILKRKRRKTSGSYFSYSDDDLHHDSDNWPSNITNISKSMLSTCKWNKNLLDDTQQTNTSELIQSLNEAILESPHFPYCSRNLKRYY